MAASIPTHFAPSGRDDKSKIFIDADAINNSTYVRDVLDALPNPVLILNKQRQMVFGNSVFYSKRGDETYQSMIGLRPGEILGCIHAAEEPDGCGTSRSCRYCGAVNVVLNCMKNKVKTQDDVRLTTQNENFAVSYDFKVTASPWLFNNSEFVIVTLEDISDKKRKEVLERIFFHDLLNKAGSLSCFFENLKMPSGSGQSAGMFEMAANLSNEITEEINAYRSVAEAESGDLKPSKALVNTRQLMDNVVHQIKLHTVAYDKKIELLADTENITLLTDYYLLSRVIMNMLKNALEAVSRNGVIQVSCRKHNDGALFIVHNDREMEEHIKYQVFQRSFSTKGTNRGLGTYSMKLLGEKYLGGKIYFTSDSANGTSFYFEVGNLPGK